MLPLLGVIALHDADSAQRFRQPAGDLSVDLSALTEDRADGPKGLAQAESEDTQKAEGDGRHYRTDAD